MRTRSIVVLLVAAIAVAALAVLAIRRVRQKEASPLNYAAAAEDLAVLSQSLDKPLAGMGTAWLPDSVQKLHPPGANVGLDGAELSGGRGYPFYQLRRLDPDAGRPSSIWTFTISNDGGDAREIARVDVPRDRRISMPELIDHAFKGYAKEIESEPNDHFRHFTRIEFAFRFRDRSTVRALLVDSVARAPALSEPRMALALVDAADHRPEGLAEIERWANDRPTFGKRSDVALVHWMLQRPDAAIEAIKSALTLKLTEDKHQNLNCSARVLPIAELALATRRYEAAIEITTKMLQTRDVDEYTRKRFDLDWRAVRAAATYRNGDHAGAVALVSDGLVEPETFYRSDTDSRPGLAAAIKAGDDAAVEAWRLAKVQSPLEESFFGRANLLHQLGLDAR